MDIVLACDASAYGIGAVLAHKMADGSEHPVGFASKTLKYSQIEKETLACVHGVKRFHSYLFGHKFCLVTDHKPLLSILHEHCSIPMTVSNRIQRWALTLSMYEYHISFKSSDSHCNADALSRLPSPCITSDPPVPCETILVLEQLDKSPVSVAQIRSWTRRDSVLSQVLQYIMSGWPDSLDPSDGSLKPFLNRKLELSVQDNVILWGNRVVIPSPARTAILQELHACHPGIAWMKTLARTKPMSRNVSPVSLNDLPHQLPQYVTCLSPRHCLDEDLSSDETYVKECITCQSQRPAPPAAPIHPWSWPSTPWSRLHLDLAGPFLGHIFNFGGCPFQVVGSQNIVFYHLKIRYHFILTSHFRRIRFSVAHRH